MNWNPLSDAASLDAVIAKSADTPQVIFKHSTRCSISSMAKARLERGSAPEGIDFHYLDLIRFRELSNEIAEKFKVEHESPQILMIRNGECTYDESHTSISMDAIAEEAAR